MDTGLPTRQSQTQEGALSSTGLLSFLQIYGSIMHQQTTMIVSSSLFLEKSSFYFL